MLPPDGADPSAEPADQPNPSGVYHAQNRRATAAVATATGRSWCPTCARFQPIEGGRTVLRGRNPAFRCRWCAMKVKARHRAIVARSTVIDG